ncbi:Prefoldin subunit 4 [Endogone sp. FLAS-F59071]|nr:Prefoldin subunit 4 [Endogone sp. FLAS-F59071]|eukprot:RUS17769.1 Prefoldin subunit 4 [Endogone sp. FLAS-F59071]
MSNIRLLKEEEEADAEVSWEDQQKINAFSKLNSKSDDLEELYNKCKVGIHCQRGLFNFISLTNGFSLLLSLQQEKEYLEDLSQELELADEDEPVRYKMGDAYVHLTLEDAQARITKDQEAANQQLEEVKTRIDDVAGKMGELKTQLYAKFGKAINLEKN